MDNEQHLTEDQISAALDDPLDDLTRQHLAACPDCRSRLDEARQREARLMDTLYRYDCPSPERLRDYAMALAEAADSAAVLSHLQACALCRAELAEMQAFLATDEFALAEAPPVSFESSGNSFSQLGDLLLRPASALAVAALRGDTPDLLSFEAEGFTLLIEIEAGLGHYAIMGQIIAADLAAWRGALVECRQERQVISSAFVSEAGIFRCELADSRPVRLRIIPETGRPIFVQDILLGPAS